MKRIGAIFQCNPSTVKNILKAYGVQSRNLSQARNTFLQRTIDENVFEKINTSEKAYWLGVMYSDGYISKRKYTNYFGIAVATKDKKWIEKFKDFLNYNGSIHDYLTCGRCYKTNIPYSRLLVGNNKIVQDLEKWGVIEHKTKRISKMPSIPFLDDFIQGYIDGDGSLKKSVPTYHNLWKL